MLHPQTPTIFVPDVDQSKISLSVSLWSSGYKSSYCNASMPESETTKSFYVILTGQLLLCVLFRETGLQKNIIHYSDYYSSSLFNAKET